MIVYIVDFKERSMDPGVIVATGVKLFHRIIKVSQGQFHSCSITPYMRSCTVTFLLDQVDTWYDIHHTPE